jgi:hypothetical protein
VLLEPLSCANLLRFSSTCDLPTFLTHLAPTRSACVLHRTVERGQSRRSQQCNLCTIVGKSYEIAYHSIIYHKLHHSRLNMTCIWTLRLPRNMFLCIDTCRSMGGL